MTGKQITELESTSVFAEGDLLLTRKTSSGTDKKINYTDLVESIGNPAIEGFVATGHPTEANTIILTPVNNAKVYRYLTGMKISFVSPIKNTFDVKIKIGKLPSVDFLQYQSIQGVSLEVDDYVEGVFINSKFYQINNFKSVKNIYSNEYSVVATDIAEDESSTTITLISSIGLSKTSYYDGMSINFVCAMNTKGNTKVRIDSIPNDAQDILEPVIISGAPRSAPLSANQIVRAIYQSSEGGFIKDNFTIQNPKEKPSGELKAPITNEDVEQGKMEIKDKPPEELKITEYTVKNGADNKTGSYETLRDCVNAVIIAYPNAATNSTKITITIDKILDASAELFVISQDLSWITLRSDNESIVINKNEKKGFIFAQTNGRFFNFEKNTTIIINNVQLTESATFLNVTGGDVILNDLTIIGDNLTYCFSTSPKVNIELTNCHLKNMRRPLYLVGSPATLTGCTLKNWVLGALQVEPSSANVIVNLTNCDLRKSQSTNLDDIITSTNTWGTKITITQKNTQAIFSQNGVAIQPGTNTSLLAYNVS